MQDVNSEVELTCFQSKEEKADNFLSAELKGQWQSLN